MSQLIARYSCLATRTKWFVGLALCLLAWLFIVVSGISDNSPGAGSPVGEFRLLSPPALQPGGAWRVTWSSVSGTTYQLQRTADDDLNSAGWVDVATIVASGPVTFHDDFTSAPRRFYRVKRLETTVAQTFTGDPGFFVPLGTNGLPIEGAAVGLGEAGLLGPFVFRPGGRSVLGLGQGFSIEFPSGARLVTIDGRKWIEFTSAVASFGPKSPFQLRSPMSVSGISVRLLPLDGIDVAMLLAAFGLPPGSGLEVTLFKKFPLRILDGVFTADGLRGSRVVLLDSTLPLPQGTNSYSGFVLDIEPDGALRLPFSGSFGLDDNTGRGARLTVPPARPLWLELKADGGVALGGRAELAFNPGPQFSVDLLLNDPNYELAMTAKGLRFPSLSSLFSLLPPVPVIPATTDPVQLAQATEKLRCFQSAVAHFNAAVTADTPFGLDETVANPAREVARPSSVLDAWGYSALCAQVVPVTGLSSNLAHAGQSASASRDIRSILDFWAALQRLELASRLGGLQLDAATQAELKAAIDETAAAIIARSKLPDAVSSLANLLEGLRALLEIEKLRQQVGQTQLAPAADNGTDVDKALEVQLAIAALVNRFTESFAAQLGVVSGVFSPPAGSRLRSMTRPEIHQQLAQIAELLVLRQQLGLDTNAAVPMPEVLGQLGSQLWTLAAAELAQAEGAADADAFLDALSDVLELVQLVDTGLIPSVPELAGLPRTTSLDSLFSRWMAVLQAELVRLAPPPAPPVFTAAIVGGTIAAKHLPYQAAIVSPPFNPAGMFGRQFCGGSILDSRWILTAAHCMDVAWVQRQPANLAVLVGVTNLNQVGVSNYYRVDQVLVHPFYKAGVANEDYDLALVHLDRDIEFTALNQGALRADRVSLITGIEGAMGRPELGTEARVSGWGHTLQGGPSSVELRYINVPISTTGSWASSEISSRMLPAGFLDPVPGDSCQGDSGGPLVNPAGQQLGVVSFGNGCATIGYPGIYTRLSRFEPWIKAQAGLTGAESIGKMAKLIEAYADRLSSFALANVDLGPSPAIRLRHERAEALLADAVARTNALPAGDLLAALRLGTAYTRLRDLLSYDSGRWWEGVNGQTNLLLLAASAAQKVREDKEWSEVSPTLDILLAEADRLGAYGGRQADRQLYLQAARLLLEAVREAGGALFDNYAGRIGGEVAGTGAGFHAASPPAIADLALPGELRVHRVAGAARFNRETRAFNASFSGELELPGFDLRLTIPNASIASGGFFDLSVHGQVSLPPGSSQGRLIIPPARPLHVSLQRSGQLNFSGAARLELNNGMAFEAFLQLEDPLYRFGLSAQGLRFDFADSLRVMVPTLPDGQQFTASAARDLNDYFRSLSATLDGVREATAAVAPRSPGEPPTFSVPTAVLPTDDLEAWANARIADTHLNLTRDYTATLAAAKQNLQTMASFLKEQRGNISPDELDARLRILGKTCLAIELRRQAGQNAEADAIATAPEFREFLQETEAAVLALLQGAPAHDEAWQEAALEMVGTYQKWGPCFDESSRLRIVAALESYQQGLWTAFASSNGISATTGLIVDPAKLPVAPFTPFRPAFTLYTKLAGQHQALNLSTPASSWVQQVGQTLAMRWRSALLAQIRTMDVREATNYTRLGLVSRDLALVLCAGQQGLFSYPAEAIEQLEGAERPYNYELELRNTFLRRLQAEQYVLITERFSAGHVNKFTYTTQPAFDIRGEHLRSLDTLACRLRRPLDPVSQLIWNSLTPNTRATLTDFRPGTYLLTACDFTVPRDMADLLSVKTGRATDRLTTNLWNRFSAAGQNLFTTPGVGEFELRWALANELNDILKGPSIYTTERFSGIGLSLRTIALRDRNPQGADLVKLNRWLLDDVFTNIVKSADTPATTGDSFKITLANELYTMIQGPSIYSPQVFAGVKLSPETQELLVNTPPDRVQQLNRRLLEDAYPLELPRADVQVLQVYFPALELLRMPTVEDPLQCGLDYAGADAQEREVLQVADLEFATARLTAAETRLLQTGTSGDLQGSIKLLKELIWLAGWAEKKQLPILPKIQARLGRLTIEFTAIAQAQKAWWYLHEYTEILIEAAESTAFAAATVARAALMAEANNALRASAGLLNSFTLLLPGQRPVDLPLPGEVYINRVFGEVQYRRDTRQLSGRFGGRIEFPDLQNAYFEVTEATLNSDLQFSIQASTGGPLPFDGVTLTAAINANGGRDLPFNFTGAGTVTITNGPQFNAVVSWNGTNHTLSFNSQAGNLQSLRFTDDLVLFDAGIGFTVRPDSQAGELRANGSAGFFSKGDLPENGPITRTNFHLFAENVRAALAYQPGRVDLTFSNGTLHLPPFFYPTNMATLCPAQGPATGPSIALNPVSPVRATFLDGAIPSIGFQGELNFRQFGFETPALPGLAAAVCNATLKFSSSELPYLTNVVGSLQIPIPNQTNFVDLLDGVFTLTGYPSGRVQLRKDLTLVDLDGFKFTLLGQGHTECPLGSGLTVFTSGGFNQPPSFKLDGGLRVVAPVDMLTGENGDEAFGLACGSLEVRPGELPALDVQALQFGGTFHLGSGGPVIRNALISLEGFPNLFQLDQTHPFIARVEGRLQIPSGPEFILQDARFTFFDPNRLPKFSVAGIGVNNQNFTLMNQLPARVTQAEMHFKAPLAEVPGLLAPTNVTVLLSAEIKFPATGNPMLVGGVDQLEVEFDLNGIPRVKNLDGFELGVGAMKLPPIREIGGRVRIGGLSAGDPARVYLIGRLGGSYQGYTVVGQFAANLFGPIGFCIDVNAGAVGIPLGPTGILITGASGGESFVNNNGDPCDFSTYFSKDANGNLVAPSAPTPPGVGMTWEAFREVVERMEQQAQIFADNLPGGGGGGGAFAAAAVNGAAPLFTAAGGGSTVGMPCPGDCPPATVNIFCQPHPDQALYPGKIIAKFSSIDEPTLNRIGITQERIQSLGGSLSVIAAEVAHAFRTNVANLTPPPDPALLGPQVAAALGDVITNSFNALEAAFSNLCFQALGSPQAGETYYAVIRRLAYEGLPCADVTMTVAGNISYAGISSMAYISGKGIVSTAGSAGVIGTVYVFGVPLGQARVFVTATDKNGDPNPSICGEAIVAFGPIDLGNVKISYACPGCVTGVLGGIPEMLAALSDALLYRIASRVAPEIPQNTPRVQLIQQLLALPDQQKLGIFAELANEPLSALPPNLPQVFFQGIADVYNSINPTFSACGEVSPKIFGLPLGSSLVEAQLFATKTEVAGGFGFSPSYLFSAFLPILPGSDSASMSFAYQMTDPYAFLFGGLAGNFAPDRIASYTQSAIDSMLQNSTIAVSYEIHPFGMSMGAAAGRVILPDLTSHPVLPWSNWVRPEERGNPSLPSRHDLLLAALATNKLGDAVNWRGTTNDLFTIYPAGSPERTALNGLSLSKDYFPHGGVLGAARVTLPAMLTEKPPLDKLGIVLNQQAEPIERLTTAIDLIQNYVLRFNTNGALGFYVPAPNPPAFYDLNGQLVGQAQLQSIASASKPQDILESIKSFDIASIQRGSLYPMEQAFLRGYLDGELLGVPIVRADAVGLPADAGRSEGFLSITSNIPDSSWLKQFIPQATLIFDARGVPPRPIEERFAGLLAEMQAAMNSNADEATLRQLAETAVLALTGELPKVRLTADLQAGLQMPPPVSDLLAFTGSAHLHGFSPRYDPDFEPMNNSPFALVRREGGLAFQGDMRLKAGGVTLVDIANAEVSIVPKAEGLPALAARLEAPVLPYELITFRDVLIDFASDPNPRFTAAGRVDPLSIGDFQLAPGLGSLFNGRLEVARTGPGAASVAARLGPARLVLPSLIAGTDTVLIHGATASDPFTFSSTGNWQAKLTVSSQLSLGVGGIDVLRLGSADFQSLDFRGTNGLADAMMELALKPNLSVIVFPGQSFQRTVALSPAGGFLRVSKNGTFELTGMLGGNFAVSGLPISSVSAGASLRLTQDGLTLTAEAGQFSGGALGGVSANQASGSITFGRDGTVTLNGLVTVNPFSTGSFTVESSQGGATPITARLDGNGLVLTGARLVYRSSILAVLPEVTVQNNGNFTVSVGAPEPLAVSLGLFSLNNVALTLQRTGGTLSVPSFAGTLAIPRLNRTAGVSGVLGANGAYTLVGTLSSSVGLSGLPVATLGANATVTLTESSLRVSGNVSGGTLGQFSVVGNATASLAVTPTELTLSGQLNVSPLNFGLFTIESSAGGAFPIHLANTAITLSDVRVRAGSVLNAPLALPAFPMQLDGSFDVTVTPSGAAASRNLAGYPCSIASFTLRRLNGVVSMDPIVAALNFSGFNQSLSGAISSDGQVTLDYTGGLTMPGGWTLTSGELHLRNAGLSARGNLAVGGLGTLTLDGTIAANGGFSISQNFATQNFYGFPALNAGYTLAAPAGQAASLMAGLQLNLAGLTGPRFTGALAANGTFTLNALNQTLAIGGFGMTDLDLTLNKPGAAAAILNAAGTLDLPGFGTPINNRLNGTISAGGSPNLNWSGTLALGGFNLGSGTLILNDSGLRAIGTLGVTGLSTPTLTFDGEIQPTGAFSLSQSFGSQSVFGFPALNVVHTFSATPGSQAAITTRFNVNFGDISSLTFDGSLSTSGEAHLRAGARAWSIGSFALTNLTLNFDHAAGAPLASLSASANLFFPNFSQSVSGSFGANGSYSLRYTGGLTLGTFFAGNGALTLTNVAPRLRASGSFEIRVGTRTYNSALAMSGNVETAGSYSLVPSIIPWNLKFINSLEQDLAGFTSDRGATLSLTPSGLAGSGSFTIGNMSLPVSFPTFTSSFINMTGTSSVDSGWIKVFGNPFGNTPGDVWTRAAGTVTLSEDNGRAKVSFGGDFGIYEFFSGQGGPDSGSWSRAIVRVSSSGTVNSSGRWTKDYGWSNSPGSFTRQFWDFDF